MAASSKITAAFTATAQGMQKGIGKVVSSLNSVTKTSAKTQKALSRMTSGINFLVFDRLAQYALAAGRAFKNMVSGSINAIDAVDKLAKSTGISTEGLQVFGLAAEKAGVDQIALSGAFGRMSKRLAEATQGFGEALPALERLGLSAQDLTKLTPEEQFLKIGEAIGGLATQGEQAAAAFKIFSDQGLRLVPLFADINAQTEAARAELERFGGILSSQQIAGTVALKDNLTDVSQIFSNIVNQVTANLAPAINAVVDSFKEFVSSAGGANIGKSISEGILDAVEYAARWADSLVGVFGGIFGVGSQVGSQWETVGWLISKAFDVAERVGYLFQSVFYALQGWLNVFIASVTRLIEWAAKGIEFLGGDTGGVAEFAEEYSKEMFKESQKSGKLAGEAFSKAVSGSADQAAGDAVGYFEKLIQEARKNREEWLSNFKKEQQAQRQLSQKAVKATPKEQKTPSLDARTTAGSNFLLQAITGPRQTLEKQQLNVQKQIERNTKEQTKILVQGIG